MKKTIGIVIALVLVSAPAFAMLADECFDFFPDCNDYYFSIPVTSFSGKIIEDGYFSSSFSDSGYYFDVCGCLVGDTLDYFYAEVTDDFNSPYVLAYGTIIWNNPGTNAFIQGGYYDDFSASYIDGTLKYSKGKLSLVSKGGANDDTFIGVYTSIRGSGFVLDLDQVLMDRKVTSKKGVKDNPKRSLGKTILRPPK